MSDYAEIKSSFLDNLKTNFIKFWKVGIIYLLVVVLLRIIEVIWVFKVHPLDFKPVLILSSGLFYDFEWGFYILGILLFLYISIGFFAPKTIHVLTRIILTILIVIHAALVFYFTKMLLPLGEDLFAYSLNDMFMTVRASGALTFTNSFIILIILFSIYIITGLGKRVPLHLNSFLILSACCYLYVIMFNFLSGTEKSRVAEVESNLKINKSYYLYNQSYNYFSSASNRYFDFYLPSEGGENLLVNKKFTDTEYPFLHENNYPDVLGPFFDKFDGKPDLVFIIVESLGKAYSGEDAYLGSFTPFLDSLSDHSLYWKNNLSTTGRTFGILTGLFGSLPFAKNGFMEEAPNLPDHLTLFSLLKHNGYHTNFNIGADINFDKVGSFLKYQDIDQAIGLDSFDADFKVTPSTSGFSWGYPDKAMFQNGIRKIPEDSEKPRMSIFQTQTSHDPYIVPDQEIYNRMFLDHLTNTLKVTPDNMPGYLNYQEVYTSVIYADDAIREFFEIYRKRPNYENTIFIVTGDHRLPEVPMSTRIDRFHVPLLIYSPKLKRTKRMHGVTTHYEITPTLLSLLSNRFEMDLPSEVAWKGYVLDTSAVFRSLISNPFMRNKNQLLEYIDGEYVLSDNQLFILSDNMNLDPVEDIVIRDKLTMLFEDYKSSNSFVIDFNRIIPDPLKSSTPDGK